MTDTSDVTATDESAAEITAYPMARATGRPFDPPPELEDKQRVGPISRVSLWDGSRPWLVTRYAEQRTLLSDPRVSADITRPGYPIYVPSTGNNDSSFVFMDGPEHSRLRRMVQAPFTVRRIEAMRPAVQKFVDDLIDDLIAGPVPVDLVEEFALPVPSLAICQLLGVPYHDHTFFQDNSKLLVYRNATAEERTAARGRLLEYLGDLIGHKINNPADDLLSGLAGRVEQGELTRPEAAAMGVLLLAAGHETTANMIALGTLALLEHPGQLALLRDTRDPKRVASAVEELLRYLSILHLGVRRVALEDIEIAGQVIRAGEGIIASIDIGNRDPEVWPDDTHRLDLRRQPRGHVAFSHGVHQCLGQPLARMELQVVYGTLFRRIPTLNLATEMSKVPFKNDGFVYGVYELPVTW